MKYAPHGFVPTENIMYSNLEVSSTPQEKDERDITKTRNTQLRPVRRRKSDWVSGVQKAGRDRGHAGELELA